MNELIIPKLIHKIVEFTVEGTPISVNHMYHSRGKIRFLCKEGKLYKEKVANIVKKLVDKITLKNVLVEITFYFGDNRRRDVSNYDKGLLDSMIKIVYDDDSQIQTLVLNKLIDKENPRVDVKIFEI